jgi:hypothetical protein
MKDFSRGVSYYTKGTVEIGFPEDRVCCDYCPMLETYARKQCRKTGEYLMETRAAVGYYCPIVFLGEVDTNEGQNG